MYSIFLLYFNYFSIVYRLLSGKFHSWPFQEKFTRKFQSKSTGCRPVIVIISGMYFGEWRTLSSIPSRWQCAICTSTIFVFKSKAYLYILCEYTYIGGKRKESRRGDEVSGITSVRITSSSPSPPPGYQSTNAARFSSVDLLLAPIDREKSEIGVWNRKKCT